MLYYVTQCWVMSLVYVTFLYKYESYLLIMMQNWVILDYLLCELYYVWSKNTE